MSVIKKTISHGSIYAVGDIIRHLTTIVMFPIYTSYLTPADYGVLELLSMLIDFVSIVLGLRVGAAVFRYYCNTDDLEEQKSIISTALILILLLNAFGVGLVFVFSVPLSSFLFGDEGYQTFIILFTFSLILQAVIELGLVYIRLQQKPWFFVFVSAVKLALQVSLNVYFIVFKDMRVEGVIYSTLISFTLISIFLLIYVISQNGLSFSKRLAKELSLFSVPLMLATVGAFYLTFGDRYLLRVFSGLSEVGLYSLGYKFGFILLMVTWAPFQRIWDTQRYEIYNNEGDDALRAYGQVFRFLYSFIIFMALGIALFCKDLLIIISAPEFHSAYQIVPIILVAYIIQSMTDFCDFGLHLKKQTKHVSYGAFVAIVVITVAYFSLIPIFGAMGAAVATLIGFLVRFLWIYKYSTAAYDMNLPWKEVIQIFSLACIIYWVSVFSPEELIASIAYRTGLIVLFIVLFYLLPILTKGEKAIMINKIKSKLPA